jgi:DNA-binding transcriptional LysR family regulator
MSSEPSWDLYRTFGAVLRHGSLSSAARMLGLTQPTVARQIDALEAALGAQLFVRTYRGLTPTAAAMRLQPHAETLLQTAAAFLRAASPADELSGTVRITAGETVGVEFLPPILTGLRRSHPRLHLELSLSDAVEDLLKRKADIAVRMTEPTQKTLLVRRVNTVQIGLYAHEDYLARRGMPLNAQDLIGHDLVGFDTETPMIRAAVDPYPWLRRVNFALRTDSGPAQLALIRSGFGIGYCQSRIAARTPALVRVLSDELSLTFGMWVVMHESLGADRACQAVFDALVTALTAMP